MTVQSLSLSYTSSQSSYLFSAVNPSTSNSNTDTQGADAGGASADSPTTLQYSNYSSQQLLINVSNTDGDTLSLSAQAADLQKTLMSAGGDTSDDAWKKIIADIKDVYAKMNADIVNQVFGSGQTQSSPGASPLSDPRSFDETKAIPGLPDYWNADNTAQRIADFATSFLGAFKGSGDQFVSMIKDAIDKGFSEAKDIFGKAPDAIDQLTAKTHALVMDKIDQWAKEQGIVTDASPDAQASAQAA
jgi:hypothetical protein